MPDIFVLLRKYIEFFALVAFLGLLLAGLNFPVSEDLIIITGALLTYKEPSLMCYNLIAIYIGVIGTDFFVYWVGTRVRKGTTKNRFFSRIVPEKARNKMLHYLDKFGIFTFIVGRFIPFGFRNTLFFTAGFSLLRFRYFVIYDLVAAMISINTLFFLTYCFGDAAKKPIKIAGIILFIIVISAFATLIVRFIIRWRRSKSKKEEDVSV